MYSIFNYMITNLIAISKKIPGLCSLESPSPSPNSAKKLSDSFLSLADTGSMTGASKITKLFVK